MDTLDRRGFIRIAGAGTALATVPILSSTAARAAVTEPARYDGPVPDTLAADWYPIGMWWSPPPEETTQARYAEMAEAGFTLVTATNGVRNMPISAKMLRLSEANGLKALAFDTRIFFIAQEPREKWRSIIAETVNDYVDFPALAGLRIDDEPGADLFAHWGPVTRILQELAPRELPYINLFPTYANSDQLDAPTYQDYLDRFVAEVGSPFLSFDHYMLLTSGGIRGDYFLNWELVRAKALEFGVPTWVFILACEHLAYRLPTHAELLWQMNMSLAYGAKGIQYFTYWTPSPAIFKQALISKDGERTPLWYFAKDINNGYVQPVGRQLRHLVSERVVHANEDPLPTGTRPFEPTRYVRAVEGGPVVMGRFRQPGEHENQRWLLVANRSYDEATTATLTLTGAVDAVSEFDPAAGRYRPVPPEGLPVNRRLPVSLEPGAGRLFWLHTNQRPADG